MSIRATQLIFSAAQTVGYETLELPAPTGTQILVRTTASGISHGTEMTAFTGSTFAARNLALGPQRVMIPAPQQAPAFPFRYAGYEAVGVVEAVGPQVRDLAPGDRVWAPARHQTHFLFDSADPRLQKLPGLCSDEQAVMIHLTMVALNAVQDAQVKCGDVVAVFGGGVVGQLAARLALLDGAAAVLLSEPMPQRRELAQQVPGITAIDPAQGIPALQMLERNGGHAPDVVIECSGAVAALHQAIQAAGLGGTVIAAGMYAGPASALYLSEEFLVNRVTLKASMGVWDCPSRSPGWDLPRLLRRSRDVLAGGTLNVSGFVTTLVPFTEAQRAYDLIHREPQKHTKVMLTYAESAR